MRFHLAWTIPVVLMPLLGYAGDQPKLHIEPLQNCGSPLTADEMSALTDYLPTKLSGRSGFLILPREEIASRLAEQKKRKKKKKKEERLIHADYMLSGAISRLGRQCIVTVTLWEVESRLGLRAAWARSPCDADSILAAVESAADKLKGSISGEKMQPGVPTAVYFIENRGSPLSMPETEAASRYFFARLLGGGTVSRVPDGGTARTLSRFRSAKKQRETRYGVKTSLAKVGTKCLLSSQLYDFEKSGNVNVATAKVSCAADSVIDAIGQIADKLTAAVKKL